MNKKQKRGIGIFLLIVAVLGVGLFLNSDDTLSIVGRSSHLVDATATLVNQDSFSATYTFANIIDSANWKWADSDLFLDQSFNISVPYGNLASVDGSTSSTAINNWLSKYSPDVLGIQDKYFKASDVKLSIGSVIGVNSGVQSFPTTKIENLTAYCNKFNCWVSGVVYSLDSNGNKVSASHYFTSGVTITVTELKSGTECLDNSHCSSDKVCSNKICSEKMISLYRFENNSCSLKNILSSEKTANDYSTLSECQVNIILSPTTPQPKGFDAILKAISDFNKWISDFIKKILGFSIAGTTEVSPNTLQVYSIDMNVSPADNDFSDGSVSWQFGDWGVVDSSNNTIKYGTPERISNGKYQKNITLTIPSNIGDYALVGIITEIKGEWDSATGNWTYSNETIINKEAINLRTRYSVIEPTMPTSKGFLGIINAIVEWFRRLFGFS